MFLLLFGFWLLLNGRWTTEIALTGAVVCGLIYLLIWRFFGYSPRREWRVFRRLPGFAVYCVFLLGSIFRAAWQTICLIWSPHRIAQPRLVSFHTPLKTRIGRTMLGNSITLTPGTITVDIRDDAVLVHALDTAFAEGLGDSEMERRISRLEGGRGHDEH